MRGKKGRLDINGERKERRRGRREVKEGKGELSLMEKGKEIEEKRETIAKGDERRVKMKRKRREKWDEKGRDKGKKVHLGTQPFIFLFLASSFLSLLPPLS